jgi:hypothetical protein
VQISFESNGNETTILETFETEQENTIELQHNGWQAILNNFKKYAELLEKFELLHFEVCINAHPEKVYKIMLSEKTYEEWTSEFSPSSHFEGTWEKGTRMQFLGTDKDGKIGGMVSRVKENIVNRFVSIEHLAMIQDGKEISDGPGSYEWAGATENYSLFLENGRTLLAVDADCTREFVAYFMATWPNALKKLKSMCEM